MLGAIVGDVIGSRFEGAKFVAPELTVDLLGANCDFTDDSVCTIAVADILTGNKDAESTLRDWCSRYPNRGYGGRFAMWIRDPFRGPYQSFGNGAAMRISPAALLFSEEQALFDAVRVVTSITHDHEEGLRGANAIALAVRMSLNGEKPDAIADRMQSAFGYSLDRSVSDYAKEQRFDETCQYTVPQALVAALNANSFREVMLNCIRMGGDVDTTCAIAGGIAEGLFGVPKSYADFALDRLSMEMQDVLELLYCQAGLCFNLTDEFGRAISEAKKPGFFSSIKEKLWAK